MIDCQVIKNKYDANIFIVEDEEVAAKVIYLYLVEAGFKNIHVFLNPVEAFETMRSVCADVILTDVNMPELGGKFLTKLARRVEHLKQTPIIAITSDDSEATRNNLIGNGITEVLPKPVSKHKLIRIVKDMIKFRNLAIENSQRDRQQLRANSFSKVAKREQNLRAAFDRVRS